MFQRRRETKRLLRVARMLRELDAAAAMRSPSGSRRAGRRAAVGRA